MARKYIDCRDYPSDIHCSLKISGEEQDVIRAAAEHGASVHGYQDSGEFREKLRGMLKDDTEASAGKDRAVA
ncbi:MAG: DUF1059 domain-containing protein [Oligoflexia bacterium]|nr:DUF1059 domain-containing protein [Oligoflexia bacterium]